MRLWRVGSMGTIVLLDVMGGVALLLWGLHMVHSGILRAFGSDLRQLLSKALGNRFAAFAAGLGLTALLQSSTATALMTASFTAEGLVGLVPALAIVLGANVGTTLIVQLLSFNISVVAPVLFVIGVVAFRGGARTRVKDLGRVACRTLSSRAEEFHLRALPKPCVNLSIHTAPDVRPLP